MSNLMRYKGYTALVDFDAEDGTLWGRLAGIEDGVSFEAETPHALRAAFEDAVDDYILTCSKIDKRPETPTSDVVAFHLPRDLRVRAAERAHAEGRSLDDWAIRALDRASRAA